VAASKQKKETGETELRHRGGIPVVDLEDYPSIVPIPTVPKEISLGFGILPIQEEEDGFLLIAFPASSGLELLDEVRFSLQIPFRPVFAETEQIEKRLRILYGGREVVKRDPSVGGAVGSLEDASADVATANAVAIFRRTLEEAIRVRASDIHFEPMKERLRVRIRVDGVLHDVNSLPLTLKGPIISHIKVAANLDITEKRLPQDGRIEYQRNIDLRVSTLPVNQGESVVLRILERGIHAFKIDEIGISPADRTFVEGLLAVQDGFIVVTGPTGSGKTTTLYAFLSAIADPSLKVITVEDPVEYITEGFTQIPIDAAHGTDFGNALRSILRHDPDIVLLGEIRDEETARTALQAALTGHQVFSTLHTNDAPTAVGRLIKLGVAPYLVNAALTAVIAQRLVRKICTNCQEEHPATLAEKHRIERANIPPPEVLYRGKGCPQCYNSGYRSRIGIFEIITMTPEIQSLILSSSSAGKIRDAARAAGMKGMMSDGMLKACQGLTTVEEVVRVLY